jgi:flagellar L-ring protein precursor FlgH
MNKVDWLSGYGLAITGLLLFLLAGCSLTQPKRGEPGFTPVMPPSPAPTTQRSGAIFQSGYEMALFEDIKAKRVGDVLTVVLVEKTDASKTANTDTARDTEITIPNPTVFGGTMSVNGRQILQNSLESQTAFTGKGNSVQKNKLDGTITVSVARVLPNGNLLVQGEKWIGINQGEEYIRLQGMVRPVDIQPDNTVESTKIGNAQIAYGGKGTLADSNRKGWLASFFTSVIWPF